VHTVVVLGAGAVGSLFGARLAAAGASVLLIGRPAHVAAIRTEGLTVEGVDPGTFRVDAATELPPGTASRAVLVTVKSFDLASAAGELGHALRPTPTALLGNGLGIEEAASRAVRDAGWAHPEAVLVRGVHTIPATLLGPGRVRASGRGEVVFPSPTPSAAGSGAIEALVGLFRDAGVPVRTSSTFDRELWRKAVVNAAINPVTAVRGVLNGALARGPARKEAEALLAEAVAVARAEGVDLTLETALADLERVVQQTAENRSSMLQDVERGRPTELEAISGEILRRGGRLGLQLPATERAVAQVLGRLNGRERPAQR